MEDAGALPFEADVSNLNMGDAVISSPMRARSSVTALKKHFSTFELKSQVLLDEVRAGGRINLIIGRGLTSKAREALNLGHRSVPPTCATC